MLRRSFAALTAGLVLGLAAAPRARADIGLRAGFSLSPDQVVLGIHNNLSQEFIPSTRLVLPVVELGLGDSGTRLTGASDLVVKLPHVGAWQFYAGGELALNLFFSDGDDSSDLGVSGIAGIERPVSSDGTAGFEFKIGFVDSPDVQIIFLYTFGSTVQK